MSHISRTTAGNYRANWRDPSGRKRTKTFQTRKEASVFLAELDSAIQRGSYVSPRAGKIRLRTYATGWAEHRYSGSRARERAVGVLRVHILPAWGDWPLSRIDHSSIQRWVSGLGDRFAPATAAKCFGILRSLLDAAVRDRLIAVNPADGVRTPSTYQPRPITTTITRAEFNAKLLPAVPREHQGIVCVAAGAGLRWGECAGLPWGAVDLESRRLRVGQVVVETARNLTIKPYPKSRAGVRVVPLPAFVVAALQNRIATLPDEPDPRTLVFCTANGTPLRRSNFRRQVWRPALVRAGMLGSVACIGPSRWIATWPDKTETVWSKEFANERDATHHVALRAAGGLRFHDLRHSYATWLVTGGAPINDVQAVMGHEQASTTLNRYTHHGEGSAERILGAFDEPAYFSPTSTVIDADQASDDEVT